MSLLKILHFPDKKLHRVAKEITIFDKKIEILASDMLETMYNENGIGLAATQVDVLLRLVVMDLSNDLTQKKPEIFINPIVLEKYGDIISEEGCLSVPGIYEKVHRYEQITIQYQDLTGNIITEKCDGLRSICFQHEIDHLNGKVFVEYLSPMKLNFIKKKIKKQHSMNM
jgi:peptide deformylase